MTRGAPDGLIALARRAAVVAAVVALVAGCGGGDDAASSSDGTTTQSSATTPSAPELDRVVKIDGDRGLYVRCTGTRLAHSDHGGRRRGHERLVRVRRTDHLEVDADVRLRPRQPWAERSGFGSARSVGSGRRPRAAGSSRQDPAAVRAGRGPLEGAISRRAMPRRIRSRSRASSSSTPPPPSETRLARSWRRPTRPTRRTSRSATSFRWRRTRGMTANGSGTSP